VLVRSCAYWPKTTKVSEKPSPQLLQISTRRRWFFAPYCDRWQKLVSPFRAWNKRQSMEWHHLHSPSKKKAKTVPSAAKVVGTVFWDAEGLILAEFLEPGQTITAVRYVQTLHELRRALHDKRLEWNIVILHDNARPHAARLTLEAIAKIGWEVLPHPSYSPDLAPSDCHLFGFVKDQAARTTLWDNGGNLESSASVSSDGWNGILQKGNFQTPRTLEEMCTEKWRLCGKIKKCL